MVGGDDDLVNGDDLTDLVNGQVEEGEEQHGHEHVDDTVGEADVDDGVLGLAPHRRPFVVGEPDNLTEEEGRGGEK